ncbi:MAG: polyphosphate kinase 1 [Gammaproteobacteria bacterium]|nr:polyphosphate kinase 1 [Gammaproteobacteria bacterium]
MTETVTPIRKPRGRATTAATVTKATTATAKPATAKPAATVDSATAAAQHEPAAAAVAAAAAAESPLDLRRPEFYLNRELTWLNFNRRVLHEAIDERNPLLERLKFFAIFASNIDEFFMKRIGGLILQDATGVSELSVDGRTPQQQLAEARALVVDIEAERDRHLPALLAQLAEHDIRIVEYQRLDSNTQDAIRRHYIDNIFPLVTPQVIDPAHPFPFISNLSLNIMVTIQPDGDEEAMFARVKVPVGTGIARFIRVGDSHHFVPLEDVMANNLDLLFPEVDIVARDFYFVARNAAAERSESGANDLMEMIELELRDRRIAPIVRMVVNRDMADDRKGMLAAELRLDMERDVFVQDGLMMQRELMQLASLPIAELRYPPHVPVNHHRLQDQSRSIFYLVREVESLLLQHPYESFATSVVRFLGEAARDPKVRALKMTLYRTDKETRIVDLLIEAARNGKQVAVVVELKAKFDEAANIEWSERMEEAGIHVTYGVIGLKTHCKVLMVVRQDYSGLRRYAHIGTGNYHGGTARLYTDLGLLSCDEDIGHDVTELFNYLTTGTAPKRNYRKIIPAPRHLKKTLLANIEREIETHSAQTPGLIQIKTNALEDSDLVAALYRASQAGVKVELIIRDTCRLRPGLAGISDNISVISIVGRFLEHSRIFYFQNGGDEEYLIGSADLMKRNLESRVEVVVRITPEALKKELRLVLNTLFDDNQNAWEMQPDGGYIKRRPASDDARASQLQQIDFAHARLKGKKHKKLLRSGRQRKRN